MPDTKPHAMSSRCSELPGHAFTELFRARVRDMYVQLRRFGVPAAALLLLVASTACILQKEIVGATITGQDSADPGTDPTDNGASHTTAASPTTTELAGEGSASHSTGDGTDGGASRPYGALCEFSLDGEPFVPSTQMVQQQDACAGGICLYASDRAPAPCDGPADCTGMPEQSGVCSGVDGHCELDPEWVHARSLCTQVCDVDADCPAADACATGFVCAMTSELGPLCCTKMCVCADDFSVGTAQELALACAQGLEGCDNS